MCILEMMFLAHMQLRSFETKVSKGITQLSLRLHHLSELTGQRLCQIHNLHIFTLVFMQHIDSSLQFQIHGA